MSSITFFQRNDDKNLHTYVNMLIMTSILFSIDLYLSFQLLFLKRTIVQETLRVYNSQTLKINLYKQMVYYLTFIVSNRCESSKIDDMYNENYVCQRFQVRPFELYVNNSYNVIHCSLEVRITKNLTYTITSQRTIHRYKVHCASIM